MDQDFSAHLGGPFWRVLAAYSSSWCRVLVEPRHSAHPVAGAVETEEVDVRPPCRLRGRIKVTELRCVGWFLSGVLCFQTVSVGADFCAQSLSSCSPSTGTYGCYGCVVARLRVTFFAQCLARQWLFVPASVPRGFWIISYFLHTRILCEIHVLLSTVISWLAEWMDCPISSHLKSGHYFLSPFHLTPGVSLPGDPAQLVSVTVASSSQM